MLKRLIGLTVLAAAGGALYLALPPSPRTLPPLSAEWTPPVRGAFHVHTRRSDGTGTIEDVAAAAARAGLKFVLLTDHGDGTREGEPPRYRQGVLCIDAVEISTDGGHVVALDLPKAPYPLAGDPRDVLDDIARLGGFSIAAHPGSEKPELRWLDWTAPFGGLEWLNGDSEWRDESRLTLARALFTYPFRGAESLATVLDRPDAVLRQWDTLTRRRRVVALAAVDAHARLGLRSVGEPYDNSARLPIPSYEQSLRTFSISVPDVKLTGNAADDERMVIAAIRAGHVYSSIDVVAAPTAISFTAASGRTQTSAGDVLSATGPVALRVKAHAPSDAQIILLKDGMPLMTHAGAELEHTVGPEAAAYRVEVQLPGAPGEPPVPWMLTNPIYVGRQPKEEPVADAHSRPTRFAAQYDNGPATGWRIENSQSTAGALDAVASVGSGTQLAIRYALGGAASMSPYVAVVMPAGPALSNYDRLMFTARADHPTRLSVQLRAPSSEAGERWHRSVYLDMTPRQVTVYFDEMTPKGQTATSRPVLSEVRDVLFVIDTINTKLGTGGQILLDDVKYAK